MKILIVSTNVVEWGGSEVLWSNVAEALLAKGHEVMVSVFRHKPLANRILNLAQKGAVLHKRPFPSYTHFQPFYSRAWAELKLRSGVEKTAFDWQKVVSFKPERVLISSGETFDFVISYESFLIQYCLKNKIPYTLLSQFNWEHSMDVTLDFRESRSRLVNHANAHLFVSYRNLRIAEVQLGEKIERAFVVNNPAKISGYLPYPKSNTLKMAMVARLQSFIKGQANVISALSTQKWQDIDFELHLYGSGKDLEYLQNLIAFYKLNKKIVVHGQKVDIEEIWLHNQVLLLPSMAEGTSLALLEAMKAGRTAVVTNVGDSALWVQENGFVAESNTLESLDKVLWRAFEEKHTLEERGKKCHETIKTAHNAQQETDIADYLVENNTAYLFDPNTYLKNLDGSISD